MVSTQISPLPLQIRRSRSYPPQLIRPHTCLVYLVALGGVSGARGVGGVSSSQEKSLVSSLDTATWLCVCVCLCLCVLIFSLEAPLRSLLSTQTRSSSKIPKPVLGWATIVLWLLWPHSTSHGRMVLWESGTRVVGCSSVLSPNINFLWRLAVTASSDSFWIVVLWWTGVWVWPTDSSPSDQGGRG